MVAFFKSMDNGRLGRLIERIGANISCEPGGWQFDWGGRKLWVLTDEAHDRMRVMTPVAAENELDDADHKIVLSANFDRALDAKYALARGYLWAVFTHPLSELSASQFLDAVKQVAALAENYGTTYTSTDLVFGGE